MQNVRRAWESLLEWVWAHWDVPLFQFTQGIVLGLLIALCMVLLIKGLNGRTTMSEWISVKDALPESVYEINDGLMSSKPVLVYGFDGNDRVYGVAQYLTDPNDKDWSEWDGMMISVNDAMYCHITHWCPIPDPPQEVDDGQG